MNSILKNLISKFTDAIPKLTETDTLLTRIGKNSNITKSELKALGDTAYDTASKYGKTADSYLASADAMAKAHAENVKAMAELSLLAQTAGDISSDTADKYLIAANVAYDLKSNVKDLSELLNGQYSIAANTSVSLEDMASATSEAASSAAQYGITMEELSSLIAVAASSTNESGTKIGNSLASVFENLQNVNDSSVTGIFDSLNISMTIMEDGIKRLKTPIELLKELSEVYSSLSVDSGLKNNILTSIGSDYNSNTISAILSDWSAYEEMLTLYSTGSGSVFEGAELSADSLSGALTRLNNTWEDTVGNVMSSDELTAAANGLNSFLSIINKITEKIGSLGTLGATIGGILTNKNEGKTFMFSKLELPFAINMLIVCNVANER